jgi:uncharacterized protein (DUF736 family)
MEFDNTNRGVLFKNDTENPKAPQYKGSINVNGQEMWLSAWVKQSQSGKNFMSLSVQPKEQQQPQQQQQQAPQQQQSGQEEIPF